MSHGPRVPKTEADLNGAIFIIIKYRYSWDYIGFYFDLDLDCEFGYFVFEDGDRVMNGKYDIEALFKT